MCGGRDCSPHRHGSGSASSLQGVSATRLRLHCGPAPVASELNDISFRHVHSLRIPPPPCPTCSPAKVNQSTAAVLDAVHGGICSMEPVCGFGTTGDGHHPPGLRPRTLALEKRFIRMGLRRSPTFCARSLRRANGAQRDQPDFDITTASTELQNSPRLHEQSGVICAASAETTGSWKLYIRGLPTM